MQQMMSSITPYARVRPYAVALAALAVGLSLPSPAAAAPDAAARAGGVPSSTGWLDLRLGLSFADSMILGDQLRLTSSGGPAEIFGVGATYRTPRLDLGLLLEGLGSFSFEAASGDSRTGSQLRVAASLRWRYVEEPWGALFVRLSPGLIAFAHADALRGQAAELVGRTLREADRNGVGWTIGVDFGVLLYLSPALALSIHLDLVTGATALDVGADSVDLVLTRGLVTAGLEWRM